MVGKDDAPRTGRLLVASPALHDPNFSHTVILLVNHDEDGTLGVVLNRPGEISVASALPAWEPLAVEPGVVFHGGPVAPTGVLGLGRPQGQPAASADPGVGLVDLDEDPQGLPGDVDAVRLFAGHAGWGAGQLEQEIAAGGWFVVEAREGDVFSSDPTGLWRTVLRRQGGVFHTVPDDPGQN